MWGSHWSMFLEKEGIPSVFIVDEPFVADVQITCDKEGMPLLRRVIVRHPCGDVGEDKLPEVITQLIAALTSPLTHEEQSPRSRKITQPTRIAFQGSLEEVNRFFYARGWSDGLPVIPPTEESVRGMLKGTGCSADMVVTTDMMPESLTVTVEKVAVVGVMAGCEPKYMPVLLGIVEAFTGNWFASSVRSTSSFSFAVVVNGPIAEKIGMNVGINALGSGTRNKANATIGRFLRLAIICLGGSRSGLNDMSSIGNPSKYSFAFAENEKRSPWKPFHVSRGFKTEESVVTIMSGGWSHNSPFERADLDQIAKTITTYNLPTGVLIIMDPMSARMVSERGYSKEGAEEYVWSHATKTVEDFMADPFYTPFIEPVLKGKEWYGSKPMWPAHYLDLGPHEMVPVFPRDHVRIVVAGGETNPFTQVWQMSRPASVIVDKWK